MGRWCCSDACTAWRRRSMSCCKHRSTSWPPTAASRRRYRPRSCWHGCAQMQWTYWAHEAPVQELIAAGAAEIGARGVRELEALVAVSSPSGDLAGAEE